MKTRVNPITIFFVVLILLLSACASAEQVEPTALPTNTLVPTQLPTNTPTPQPTATTAPTPTPAPVCLPGNTISGSVKDDIPGYLNILSVSTSLEGSILTTVFTVRDIPDEIKINSDSIEKGRPEIAWGVAIDTDNDEDTGDSAFLTRSGYGYEYLLQAFNFKYGAEKKGSIQDLFTSQTKVWKLKGNGSISETGNGKITVDPDAKTITLVSRINEIKPDSYLYFYTYILDEYGSISDEVCAR